MGWKDKLVAVLINKALYQEDVWESGSAAPHFLKVANEAEE
jgi:hypothetical protein